jgi:hypothetical protein
MMDLLEEHFFFVKRHLDLLISKLMIGKVLSGTKAAGNVAPFVPQDGIMPCDDSLYSLFRQDDIFVVFRPAKRFSGEERLTMIGVVFML